VGIKGAIPASLQSFKRLSRLPPPLTYWGDRIGDSSEDIYTILHHTATDLNLMSTMH